MSPDPNHWLRMQGGWEEREPVDGTIVHAEIRDGKIWLYYDGLEESAAKKLVAMGIKKTNIVLAFHSPELRLQTGDAGAWRFSEIQRCNYCKITSSFSLSKPC